ncbi:hypothetical protein WG908_07480 [Sphingobium sp. AN641]|uniref:hypothetical protein n=1 Tax=Sphingobium sp. AN641 TaxID=3133443 RepID=UPI0030C57FE7
MTLGRSVDEILRLLCALQQVDGANRLTPEGWTKGKPTLLPAAQAPEAAPDWFCRFEKLA